MSQVIYRDSFTDSVGDQRHYTYTSTMETSTLSHSPQAMPSVEFPHLMGGPSHGLWSNEHPANADPYSVPAMNPQNYPSQASYTSTTGHDSLPHAVTQLAEYHGNETNHEDYQVPIAPGPLQLEYYAPVAPEVPSNDPLGYAPIPDNVAGPSQGNPNPTHSAMSDDEDLKRLASRYLNNHGAHVEKLLVRRRSPGGRRVLIVLEVDDAM